MKFMKNIDKHWWIIEVWEDILFSDKPQWFQIFWPSFLVGFQSLSAYSWWVWPLDSHQSAEYTPIGCLSRFLRKFEGIFFKQNITKPPLVFGLKKLKHTPGPTTSNFWSSPCSFFASGYFHPGLLPRYFGCTCQVGGEPWCFRPVGCRVWFLLRKLHIPWKV